VSAVLKAPFPWFGGKSAIAHQVWQAFGTIRNYTEPFFGSGAVLLARPDRLDGIIETVNDMDGMVSNFYRALQKEPAAVARWADYPVIENDLEARHYWLVTQRERITQGLNDPEWFDAKAAGWWVWGISCWIGSGWCAGEGPWALVDGKFCKPGEVDGIDRKRPYLSRRGMGINRQIPHLGDAGQGINRKRPHLGGGSHGKGIHAARANDLAGYFQALADRMRDVRICCGDWSRITGPSVTCKNGLTGVFLDPPYSFEANRDNGLYAMESGTVAHDVRAWCIENGNNPLLRIVLCGYDTEHYLPGWDCIPWKANGGMSNQGDGQGHANRHRECLWLSPHCVSMVQERLFA
jgi:hypothetical protein